MSGEDKPAENKEGGKRSRRKKQPPLQPDSPLDETLPASGKPEVPPVAGGPASGPEAEPAHGVPGPEAKGVGHGVPGPEAKGVGKAAAGKSPRVAEVMTEDPVCCVPETPLVNVARLMAENSCGAIPVLRSAADRTPLGIVTDRDVAVRAVAEGRNPLQLSAGDVMSRPPVTIGVEETLASCAVLMRERQVRRIVVVDAAGRARGLVVLAQVARHLPREVSGEIVKDIIQPPHRGGD